MRRGNACMSGRRLFGAHARLCKGEWVNLGRAQAAARAGARGPRNATGRRWRRWFVPAAVIIVVVGVAVTGAAWYARKLGAEYRATRASIETVQALVPSDGSGTSLPLSKLPELASGLTDVNFHLRRLNQMTDIPLATPVARRLPIVGERVRATQELLALGIRLSDTAISVTAVASDVYAAYETNGLAGPQQPGSRSWLEVVRDNRGRIDELQREFDAALADRAALNAAALPARGQRMLGRLDPLLGRAQRLRDNNRYLLDYYPMVATALAANGERRYLVMLQNSQEIRPAGGFPGTYAVVTLAGGRLVSYDINSITELDRAYVDKRQQALPAPAPLRKYLLQEDWLPHDALWGVDFGRDAQTLLEMYATGGGPPVDGVIAIGDAAVRDIMGYVGSLTVDIDGNSVTLDATNVIDVIESYRAGPGAKHKVAVGAIGAALIERIRAVDTATQRDILRQLRTEANRREIQVYARDPAIQAEVTQRAWDGSLNPQPGTPTIAATIANIIGNKASRAVQLASVYTLYGDERGVARVRWTLALTNTGNPNGDQLYNGFHRTWLALYLPDGARVTRSTLAPEPAEMNDDPRAIGYQIELYTSATVSLTVEFDLASPTTRLLLRRQSGVNPIATSVVGTLGGCALNTALTMNGDIAIDTQTCAVGPTSP